jgi:hypothetical protein
MLSGFSTLSVVSIVFRTFVSQAQDLQFPGRRIFLSLIRSEGDVPLPCPVPWYRVVPCPYTSGFPILWTLYPFPRLRRYGGFALPQSCAATSMRAEFPSGKFPATRILLRIFRLIRSRGLFVELLSNLVYGSSGGAPV